MDKYSVLDVIVDGGERSNDECIGWMLLLMVSGYVYLTLLPVNIPESRRQSMHGGTNILGCYLRFLYLVMQCSKL